MIGLDFVWFALQAANKIMTLIISTLAFLFIILRSPQVFILVGHPYSTTFRMITYLLCFPLAFTYALLETRTTYEGFILLNVEGDPMKIGTFLLGGIAGAAAVIYLNRKSKSMLFSAFSSSSESMGKVVDKAKDSLVNKSFGDSTAQKFLDFKLEWPESS